MAAVIAVFVMALAGERFFGSPPLPYGELQRLIADGKVKQVVVSRDLVEGIYVDVEGKDRHFVSYRVDPEIAKELTTNGVAYSGKQEGSIGLLLLSWIAPALVFVGIWWLVMRRAGGQGSPMGGLMAIGKSRAKVFVETETKVTFQDVAGVEEAKDELQEVVAFLKDPKGYGRLGARMPKGVLLVGPPGTGKTLLARAVAGEAGVPFYSISGSEFVEMFVGVGAARVRDLFAEARVHAPCIIFIDELDALGRARGSHPALGGHDEKEQTLNQLLVELDGFDPSAGIVLLAATNRPEILDAALLRSGRFDRQILVDRPDRAGRVAILNVHLRTLQRGPDIDTDAIAALTPGFTGADLANLANEAALAATRRKAEAVAMEDVNAAIERIVAGLEKKNRLLNPLERRVVAHHEMGHALVAAAIPGCDAVHKISIIPRGIGALGYTIQRPTEDRYLMTRDELLAKMAVLLGGRAAERVVFDHLSTGASDDLAKATNIARSMVTRYGFDEKLGHVTYDTEPAMLSPVPAERHHSDATTREIDCALRDLLEGAFARAVAILERNRGLLDEGAGLLLERETLTDHELAPLFGRVQREPAKHALGDTRLVPAADERGSPAHETNAPIHPPR